MAASDRKIWANKNGVWSPSSSSFNVGGTWVNPIAGYGKINGGWKQFWPPTGAALFTADGTWTVPMGITRVNAIVMGGGAGGGAGRIGNNGGGGGGGGGAIAKQENLVVVPGTTCRVTIGQGGRGAEPNSGRAGSNGGTSSFVLPSGQAVNGWGGGGGGGMDQPPPQTPGGGGGGGAACNNNIQNGAAGAASGGRGWSNGQWDLGGGGGGSNYDGAPAIVYDFGKFSGASGWSAFLNTYGIWNSNVNTPTFDQSFNVYFGETGNYIIEASIDNYGQVLIDGVVALNQPNSDGYRTSITSAFNVNTGWHTVRLACTNTGGPGAVGVKITSPTGKEMFNTVNLPRGHEGGNADGINGYGGDGSEVRYLDANRNLGSVVVCGGGAGGYHLWRGATVAQISSRNGGAGSGIIGQPGGGNPGQDGSGVGCGGGGCAQADGPTGNGYRGQVYLYW